PLYIQLIKTFSILVQHRPFYLAIEGFLCLTGHPLICPLLMSTRSSCDSSQLLLSNIHAVNKRIVGSLGTIIIKHEDFQLFSCIVLEWRKCLNVASSTELCWPSCCLNSISIHSLNTR
uniref:Uncharacterized protein n=1 Tax=Spermophilus dauricus TaxID=99837 RepID=A0A8C9PM19_SPEDA